MHDDEIRAALHDRVPLDLVHRLPQRLELGRIARRRLGDACDALQPGGLHLRLGRLDVVRALALFHRRPGNQRHRPELVVRRAQRLRNVAALLVPRPHRPLPLRRRLGVEARLLVVPLPELLADRIFGEPQPCGERREGTVLPFAPVGDELLVPGLLAPLHLADDGAGPARRLRQALDGPERRGRRLVAPDDLGREAMEIVPEAGRIRPGPRLRHERTPGLDGLVQRDPPLGGPTQTLVAQPVQVLGQPEKSIGVEGAEAGAPIEQRHRPAPGSDRNSRALSAVVVSSAAVASRPAADSTRSAARSSKH